MKCRSNATRRRGNVVGGVDVVDNVLVTDEFAPAAEFDAIARLAAGLLDAPVATITRLAERALRLGGSGMSWSAGDEEPFLRAIAKAPAAAHELPQLAGAELLVTDGMCGAYVVPLRIPHVFLAVYAPVSLAVSIPLRRRLADLGELASQFLQRLPAAPSPAPAAERALLAFAHCANDRIAIADAEGRLLYANESLARTFNVEPHELVGRPVSELVAPAWKHLPGLARIRDNVAHGMAMPIVRELELPNGRLQTLEIAMSPFVLDGATHVGLIGRDLSATTQRLEATMESAAIGLAHVALDGQFLRFNAQLKKLLGRSATELRVFRDSLDIAPPADQRGISCIEALGLTGRVDLATIRAQFVSRKAPYTLEYELVRPDKTTAWIDLSIAPVTDATGRPDYFVLVAREITAERRADIALRGLAATLAQTGPALFTGVADMLGTTLGARCVLVGRLDGPAVMPTAAWLNGAPYDAPRYALVGTPCETLQWSDVCYYPERLQAMFPDDHMLVDLGVTSYLGAPLRATDGRVIGIIAVLGDHPFDPALAAEDVMRLCATRVATELERIDTLAELATREEQLRQITESAQEVFWLSEWPSRHLLYVSPAFEALTGRTIASVYANRTTWGAGLHPDDRPRVNDAMSKLEEAPADVTARVIRPDGQLRWIQIRAALVLDGSARPYRVAGSFEDITQIIETQQALEERERQLTQALATSEREVEALHSRLGEHVELHGMVGSSQSVRAVYRRLRQAAQSDVTVLIARRIGHRQGARGGAIHAVERAAREAVRRDQLRGDPRAAARERAVRPRQGRVHRRRPRQGRPRAGRRGRHAVPRRDRRHQPGAAGQAAARAPGAAGPPRRRRETIPIDVRSSAATHRDLRGAGRERPVPRGPLLPDQRVRDHDAAAARSPRGYPGAREPLRERARARGRQAAPRRSRRRRCARCSRTAGRATCASSATRSSTHSSRSRATRFRFKICRARSAAHRRRSRRRPRPPRPPWSRRRRTFRPARCASGSRMRCGAAVEIARRLHGCSGSAESRCGSACAAWA